MTIDKEINAIQAISVEPRKIASNYPTPFVSILQKRTKRPLGDLFNITNFGVNITTLEPGGISALRHAHSKQDEFIYIIQGEATLITNEGELQLESGMCAGFKHGTGNAHQIVNKSPGTVIYLEVGDRTEGDEVIYPDNDIAAKLTDGKWQFTHKNGDPY